MVVFGDDGTGDAQRGGGRVEFGLADFDSEVCMDALRGDGAGAFVGEADFADGVCVDEVAWDDEVVRVPLQTRDGWLELNVKSDREEEKKFIPYLRRLQGEA